MFNENLVVAIVNFLTLALSLWAHRRVSNLNQQVKDNAKISDKVSDIPVSDIERQLRATYQRD